jgi:diadenosine tetraphosphatase ApaH/serine/threonine PP2A family protein phosphatase
MRAALDGVDADVVVCGHTHMQFEVAVDDVRVVNAGSIGLPYEGKPGAYWALLGESVELKRTDYDIGSAIDEFRSTDCPHVEDLVIDPLLEPPSPSEVAAHFEQREAEKRH